MVGTCMLESHESLRDDYQVRWGRGRGRLEVPGRAGVLGAINWNIGQSGRQRVECEAKAKAMA